jgi:acyl-CoA synthetase (AMP-forming)/AMP-acid ligase II
VLRKDWYYTGDIGKMDKDGFFFVVGRSKDMIKVGGERISAKEIEEVILGINQVQEVAVIGVEDVYLGEAIKSFIVPVKDVILNADDIKKHCLKHLPLFKIPKEITFLTTLPKNKSGKVMKVLLKNM